MTDKPTQLKPCPLCGGPAIYRDFPDVKHISHYIECAKGPCDLTLCAGNSYEECAAAWNTRSGDATELLREARLAAYQAGWTDCEDSVRHAMHHDAMNEGANQHLTDAHLEGEA